MGWLEIIGSFFGSLGAGFSGSTPPPSTPDPDPMSKWTPVILIVLVAVILLVGIGMIFKK